MMPVPHGAMPYGPVTVAAGHDESSKLAVVHPSGGVAGVPARAFQLPSVTIRGESSWATAITLVALPPSLMPSIAITLLPATSSGLMLLIADVCHPLFTLGESDTCVPFTKT